MSFFDDVDRLVQKFKADMINAKVAARQFGFTKVRASETGVWSASGKEGRYDARSSAELCETMKVNGATRPLKPSKPAEAKRWAKKEKKFEARIELYRLKLTAKASKTKEQLAIEKAEKKAKRTLTGVGR